MKRILFMIALMSIFGLFAKADPLAAGAEAPRITALDENGMSVKLDDYYAKGVALVYFFPKADTPGCTAQACSLRDAMADLKAEEVAVIGVSRDTAAAQKKFKEKYKLPFLLIADEDGKVTEAFGVPLLPGVGLASRQSFLIKDGKVVWHTAKAQTKEHAAEVQKALADLK